MGKHYVCDKHKTKGNTGECPLCHPDHIADATEKVKPAPGEHKPDCAVNHPENGKPWFMSCTCDVRQPAVCLFDGEALRPKCANLSCIHSRRGEINCWLFDRTSAGYMMVVQEGRVSGNVVLPSAHGICVDDVQPAPAELEGEATSEGCGKPAPVPLPGDDGVMCARLLHEAVAHISDLTNRLADAEAENGRFAGMLESSVSDWRKLYTEERAERVRIQGILLNDVQAEHQESDEHIKGLNAVIKTQDKAIRDLKSRVAEAEAERDALRERCEKLLALRQRTEVSA